MAELQMCPRCGSTDKKLRGDQVECQNCGFTADSFPRVDEERVPDRPEDWDRDEGLPLRRKYADEIEQAGNVFLAAFIGVPLLLLLVLIYILLS